MLKRINLHWKIH